MSITLGTAASEYVFQNPQLKFHCGAHYQINRQYKIQGKFETGYKMNTF